MSMHAGSPLVCVLCIEPLLIIFLSISIIYMHVKSFGFVHVASIYFVCVFRM